MEKPFVFKTLHISDDRGCNAILYDNTIKELLPPTFQIVQINQSFSLNAYTLRGIHYQNPPKEQAICYCLTGSVFNAAVNLFTGEVTTSILNSGTSIFIPRGYAHGYMTLEDNTIFQWCVDNEFCQEAAEVIRYDTCDIDWPVKDRNSIIISDRDRIGMIYKRKSLDNNCISS